MKARDERRKGDTILVHMYGTRAKIQTKSLSLSQRCMCRSPDYPNNAADSCEYHVQTIHKNKRRCPWNKADAAFNSSS